MVTLDMILLRYKVSLNKEKRPIRHLKLHLLVYSVDFFSP